MPRFYSPWIDHELYSIRTGSLSHTLSYTDLSPHRTRSVFGASVPTLLFVISSSISPSLRVPAVALTFVEIQPLGAKSLLALLAAPITPRPASVALILRSSILVSARAIAVPTTTITTGAFVFAASIAPLALAVGVTTAIFIPAPLGARTVGILLTPLGVVVGPGRNPIALSALSFVLAGAVWLVPAVPLLSF